MHLKDLVVPTHVILSQLFIVWQISFRTFASTCQVVRITKQCWVTTLRLSNNIVRACGFFSLRFFNSDSRTS